MSPAGWFSSVVRCLYRELDFLTKNPAEIIFCGIVPIMWILFVWALLGNGVMTKVPVGFVDSDRTQMTRTIANALDSARVVDLVTYNSSEEAIADMRKGKLYGVISIPSDYTRETLAGRGSSVVVYLDENRYAVAGTLQFDIQSVLTALKLQKTAVDAMKTGSGVAGAERLVSIVHSDFNAIGNPQYSFLAFLGSNLMPALVMLGAILCFVTAIIREDYQGTINDWFDTARGSVSAAVIGKLTPHFILYNLIAAAYIALFAGFGRFGASGSLFIWFACASMCLLVMAAMAVLIVGIAPTWRLAMVVTSGYAAPALPFTGFSIPMDSMGPYAKAFSKCLPLTWFIEGQSQQWVLGSSISHMGPTFTALGILFIVPALVGIPVIAFNYKRKAKKQALAEENHE